MPEVNLGTSKNFCFELFDFVMIMLWQLIEKDDRDLFTLTLAGQVFSRKGMSSGTKSCTPLDEAKLNFIKDLCFFIYPYYSWTLGIHQEEILRQVRWYPIQNEEREMKVVDLCFKSPRVVFWYSSIDGLTGLWLWFCEI